jgi:hypothetical protein
MQPLAWVMRFAPVAFRRLLTLVHNELLQQQECSGSSSAMLRHSLMECKLALTLVVRGREKPHLRLLTT